MNDLSKLTPAELAEVRSHLDAERAAEFDAAIDAGALTTASTPTVMSARMALIAILALVLPAFMMGCPTDTTGLADDDDAFLPDDDDVADDDDDSAVDDDDSAVDDDDDSGADDDDDSAVDDDDDSAADDDDDSAVDDDDDSAVDDDDDSAVDDDDDSAVDDDDDSAVDDDDDSAVDDDDDSAVDDDDDSAVDDDDVMDDDDVADDDDDATPDVSVEDGPLDDSTLFTLENDLSWTTLSDLLPGLDTATDQVGVGLELDTDEGAGVGVDAGNFLIAPESIAWDGNPDYSSAFALVSNPAGPSPVAVVALRGSGTTFVTGSGTVEVCVSSMDADNPGDAFVVAYDHAAVSTGTEDTAPYYSGTTFDSCSVMDSGTDVLLNNDGTYTFQPQ